MDALVVADLRGAAAEALLEVLVEEALAGAVLVFVGGAGLERDRELAAEEVVGLLKPFRAEDVSQEGGLVGSLDGIFFGLVRYWEVTSPFLSRTLPESSLCS